MINSINILVIIQVPCPFVFSGETTVEEKGTRTVSIKSCSTGDGEKRMCTLQMCIRAEGPQPKITIIFRGADAKYYAAERAEYDKRVHILYQKKAWADRPTSEAWVRKVLHPHLEARAFAEGVYPSMILFCDNLDSQVYAGFLDALKEKNVCRHLLVAGETEMLQPIDAGIGSILKTIVGQVQDEWLDEPGHLDAWEGDPNAELKLDARTRRILITTWVGEAWERLTNDEQYEHTFRKCFLRTGALITADGTDDNEIQPLAGMPYTVPEMVVIDDDQEPLVPEIEPEPEDGDVEQLDHNADIVDEEPHAVVTELPVPVQNPVTALVADQDQSEEDESWEDAVNAAFEMDPPLVPINDKGRIPGRLAGRWALLLVEGEWECAHIESHNDRYRYRLESSRQFGFSEFSENTHGRMSASADRWVLLTPSFNTK